MIDKNEFPEVTYLVDAYFFQNWDDVYGSDESDVLRAFVEREDREKVVALRDELGRFVARGFSPEELYEYVRILGTGPIDERVFFMQTRDALDRYLRGS